jgi:uncharacterized protein (DUF433 family)
VSELLAFDANYADGWVMVAGTGVPVARIGHANVAGQAPNEIAYDWDLTLAQVHAALSYYYSNRDQIDAAVAAYDSETERLASVEAER